MPIAIALDGRNVFLVRPEPKTIRRPNTGLSSRQIKSRGWKAVHPSRRPGGNSPDLEAFGRKIWIFITAATGERSRPVSHQLRHFIKIADTLLELADNNQNK